MISFVIPAYNEERYLGATLASIHAAARGTGEAYEVVVADDASTDATAAIAQQGGARVVRVDKRQIAATRNAGARASRGARLVFVDADTRIDGKVLAAALRALEAGAVAGGAGVRFDAAARWARAFARIVVLAFRAAHLAAGCFVFSRRDAFEAVGGFDETVFAGEEIFLSRALARRGRFVVLSECVTTSGRKLEGRSFWSVLRLCVKLLPRARGGVKDRGAAAFWYEERR